MHGGRCPGSEVRLHARSHRNDGRRLVQHRLLQTVMPAAHPRQQRQVGEIEHPGPRVAEIRYPRQAGGPVQTASDKMHRLRRAGSDYDIYRMLLQIPAEELHRRPHPSGTGIRNEEIAPHPQHQLLFERLLLGIDGIHPRALGRPAPHEFMVDGIGFAYGLLDDLGRGRYLLQHALIYRKLLGIGGGVNYGLPAILREIFGELQPALDSGASGGRPVVGYDESPTHRALSPLSSPATGRRPASGSCYSGRRPPDGHAARSGLDRRAGRDSTARNRRPAPNRPKPRP